MTDNEIIKAMESAIHRYKDVTHYVSCIVDINILKNVLDLINRQKTELKQWKEKTKTTYTQEPLKGLSKIQINNPKTGDIYVRKPFEEMTDIQIKDPITDETIYTLGQYADTTLVINYCANCRTFRGEPDATEMLLFIASCDTYAHIDENKKLVGSRTNFKKYYDLYYNIIYLKTKSPFTFCRRKD